MEPSGKIKIFMDQRELLVSQGTSILDAARDNDIPIPTLCHHPHLSPHGGCRLCMVAVDGAPRLAASCVTPVRDGMEIVTANETITRYRRTVLEFLFAERNHNCMICPASGDCELQTLAYQLRMDHLTVPPSFEPFQMDLTSPYMALDHNRCVLCGRCVRACWEISGARVLNFMHRGPKSRIGFDFNTPRSRSTCQSCGVCVQVCPTGALVNRYRTHYAVKGHDKGQWKTVESVCPVCGLSCPIRATVSGATLIRVEGVLGKKPDRPDRPDKGQLCRKGRFEVLKTRGRRLVAPMVRTQGKDFQPIDLDMALSRVAEKLNAVRDTHGGAGILGLVSANLSNETLRGFADLMARGWGGTVDTTDGNAFRALVSTGYQPPEPLPETTWKKIPGADFILVLGSCQTHPMIGALIHRAILENQAKLAVLGDGGPLSALAMFSLPMDPDQESDQEPDLIRLMLQQARQGMQDPAQGLPLQDLVNAFVQSSSPLVIAGPHIFGSPRALTDFMELARLKQEGSDPGLILLKPAGNSAGAWQLGIPSSEPPCPEGPPRAVLALLSGEEEEANLLAGPAGTAAFLAVVSPYFPETLAAKADILIPAPLWTEEDGTYAALDSREMFVTKRLLDLPPQARSFREILTALGQLAGLNETLV